MNCFFLIPILFIITLCGLLYLMKSTKEIPNHRATRISIIDHITVTPVEFSLMISIYLTVFVFCYFTQRGMLIRFIFVILYFTTISKQKIKNLFFSKQSNLHSCPVKVSISSTTEISSEIMIGNSSYFNISINVRI